VAIYLDNHSTTRLDSRVLESLLPWLTDTTATPAA
jgi:cysteine sulfinate desulfinase/cysteine desulfurase-like protein